MSLFGVKPKHDRMDDSSPTVLMDARTGQMPTAQRVMRVKLAQKETTLFGRTMSLQSVSHQLHSAARSAVTKVGHVAKKVASSKPAKVATATINIGSGNAFANVIFYEARVDQGLAVDRTNRHHIMVRLDAAGVTETHPLDGFEE